MASNQKKTEPVAAPADSPTDTPKKVVLTGARELKIGDKTFKRGESIDVEIPADFKRYCTQK